MKYAPRLTRNEKGKVTASFVPEKEIVIAAMAPEQFPTVRATRTRARFRFESHGEYTVVELEQRGWQNGEEWDRAYEHLSSGNAYLLATLHRRFVKVPSIGQRSGALTRSSVSAIVLAAGSGTRMGTIKALVRIGGEPMLTRVLSTLWASCADEIVLVLGHSAELIQQTIALEGVKVVINDDYQSGMASSIRTGLANLSADAEAALMVLADQPFLQSQTIDHLIDEYRNKRPRIAIPLYKGIRGNPVLLDRSVFPEVAFLAGDVGFRAIFESQADGILKVSVDDPGVLIDLDTAADVERFNRLGATNE